MSQYLQKGPDGLLGALDLKTTGKSPNEFPNSLQAVLECTPFYLLRNRKVATVSGPFAAINTLIAQHTVPIDEVWRVLALELTFTRNAADVALNIEEYVALRRSSGAVGGSIYTVRLEPVAATDLIQYRGLLCDLWAGPGDQFRLHIGTTVTAAATLATLTLDYESMPSG